MPDPALVAETGRPIGSRPSGRLRAAGLVPGVLYGHGMTPQPLAVDHRALRHALSGPAGVNAVVSLTVEGTTHPTVVKALQRHPVRRTLTHVDFLVVRLDERITIEVPIHVEGEAKHVVSEGGLIEQTLNALTVVTTPRNIPTGLTVDVSELSVGDVVRVGDLTLPNGVSTAIDPEAPVVLAAAAPAPAEEEVVEEVEGEEGAEEGTGAPGEASES
jgi:large subunit ribosomal protein L25